MALKSFIAPGTSTPAVDAAATAALLLKLKEKIGIHGLEDLMHKQGIMKEDQERDFQAYLQRKKLSEQDNDH